MKKYAASKKGLLFVFFLSMPLLGFNDSDEELKPLTAVPFEALFKEWFEQSTNNLSQETTSNKQHAVTTQTNTRLLLKSTCQRKKAGLPSIYIPLTPEMKKQKFTISYTTNNRKVSLACSICSAILTRTESTGKSKSRVYIHGLKEGYRLHCAKKHYQYTIYQALLGLIPEKNCEDLKEVLFGTGHRSSKVQCPICPDEKTVTNLRDHIYSVHVTFTS